MAAPAPKRSNQPEAAKSSNASKTCPANADDASVSPILARNKRLSVSRPKEGVGNPARRQSSRRSLRKSRKRTPTIAFRSSIARRRSQFACKNDRHTNQIFSPESAAFVPASSQARRSSSQVSSTWLKRRIGILGRAANEIADSK